MEKIKYKHGYKYQLIGDYEYQTPIMGRERFCGDFIELHADGMLKVKNGYAWDGPSGPTLDTKSTMRGSLIHDVLYQMMRVGLLNDSLRIVADKILYRICREDGMGYIRAKYWYFTVRKFAAKAAALGSEQKIHEAP